MTADLDSAEGQRKALADARSAAKGKFVAQLDAALRRYVPAHQGMLPTDILQLGPELDSPPDLAMLQRYPIKRTGLAKEGRPTDWAIEEAALVDEQFDSRYHVQATGGYGAQSMASGVDPTIALAAQNAYKAFLKDHPEGPPKDGDASLFLPYFNPPLDPTQQKKFLDLAKKAKDD
jgi:hypothetical protein